VERGSDTRRDRKEKKISIGGGKLRRKIIGCLIVPKM
jgi:hypothetical protein